MRPDGTEVMKPWFGLVALLSSLHHYERELVNLYLPAAHNKMCHYQQDDRLVFRSVWWQGNEFQMVAEATVETICLLEAKLARK